MKKNAKVLFAVFLALAVMFGTISISAHAQFSSEAVVTLEAGNAVFPADQAVVINVTISNPTNHTIRVLKWYTPADGVEEPLFSLNRNGQTVAYTGAIFKRPQPTNRDYLMLKAGETKTIPVTLEDYYDLSASGDYTVVYSVASPNLSSEKNSARDRVETITSNELMLKVEGRAGKRPGGGGGCSGAGNTCFQSCTTTQQATLGNARSNATTYSTDASSYLNANKTGARYTTWFGVVTSSRYNTVTSHFSAIKDAFVNAPVTIDCSCKQRYYAYVYPNQPYVIYVCAAFWSAPMTGTDSKAGTLIHEMSHFTVVAGTDDYVYGQTGAKDLAVTDPAKAVDNADNHEYFAENTPTLP